MLPTTVRPVRIVGARISRGTELFKHAEPSAEARGPGQRRLFVVVSSDKGLCGGIHSSVSKGTWRILSTGTIAQPDKPGAEPSGTAGAVPAGDSPIVVVGDKSKAQLLRAVPQNIVLTMNQIGRDIPTFADACAVADLIATSGARYDAVAIVYNRYISAVAFEASTMDVLNEAGLRDARACTGRSRERRPDAVC